MKKEHTDVYFSLGSNLGDRMSYLRFGVEKLKRVNKNCTASSIYQCEAWGYDDPKPYLNMVLKCSTKLNISELAELIKRIEMEAGRIRNAQQRNSYQARTLDIDLLFFGDLVIDFPLKIPHPRLHLRNFVLVPLAELASHYIHQVLNKSIAELLEKSEDSTSIRIFSEEL